MLLGEKVNPRELGFSADSPQHFYIIGRKSTSEEACLDDLNVLYKLHSFNTDTQTCGL